MYTVIFLDQFQPKYSVWNVVDCMSIRVDIFIETYRGSHWFDDHVLSLSFSLSDIDDLPKKKIHLIVNSLEYLQMYHPNMHACRLLLVISTDHTVATANYPTGDVQHVYVLPISHPIAKRLNPIATQQSESQFVPHFAYWRNAWQNARLHSNCDVLEFKWENPIFHCRRHIHSLTIINCVSPFWYTSIQSTPPMIAS